MKWQSFWKTIQLSLHSKKKEWKQISESTKMEKKLFKLKAVKKFNEKY